MSLEPGTILVQHSDVVVNGGGGLLVTLTKRGTSTPAELYADELGTPLAKVETNAYGYFTVWLPEGEYHESVAGSPREDRIIPLFSYTTLEAIKELAQNATEGPEGPEGPPGKDGAKGADGGAAPTISRVTSFPGSPADGEEVDYVANSAKGVVWRFRYRTAGTTNKWEFVGGSALMTAAAGSLHKVKNRINPLALTSGPTLTVPFTGKYEVGLALMMGNEGTVATNEINAVVAINGVASAVNVSMIYTSNWNLVRSGLLVPDVALTATNVLTVLCYGPNNGTGEAGFESAVISIKPIKVS